ncbi:TPA: hypothetical protein ACK1ZH_003616 [Enterobacter bugandensis]
MKNKLLAIALLITTSEASAISLTCSAYRAALAIGTYDKNRSLLSEVSTPAALSAENVSTINFTINFAAPKDVNALAGKMIRICQTITNITRCSNIKTITPDVNPISGTSSVSIGTSSVIWHLYIVEPNASMSPPTGDISVQPIVVSSNISYASVSMRLLNSKGGLVAESASSDRLMLQAKSEYTDSIDFPLITDLGTLSPGNNMSTTPIVSDLDTNSIGVKFSATTTEGASFTINGDTIHPDTLYKPPFNLGMYVSPTAQPGTYTSTVNATWTCP